MILGKADIERLIEQGTIVCQPPGKINPCSIDVSLGTIFYRQPEDFDPVFPYGNKFWESNPGVLDLHEGHECIRIDPGEVILATTEQFIGVQGKYTTMLKSKSTTARLCLDVCGSAGWGDPGYINKWSFPLQNKGMRSIYLRPGTWIAQLVFMECSSDEDYTKEGSYQTSSDINTVMETWKPEDILPAKLKVRE